MDSQRLWRLTGKSVEKLATAFNMGPRQIEDLRSQSMSIRGGTRDPKSFWLKPVKFERVPRDPHNHRLADHLEFELQVIFEIEHGFFFPLILRLSKEFDSANRVDYSSIAAIVRSVSLDVDNLTDAERAAEEASKLTKRSKNNIVNIDVSDAGRAHQLLRQLTAIGLTQGFESTVCYIPRPVAVLMSASGLRALGNVEVYETDTELGTQYRGKSLELAIILEVFGPKVDEHHIVGVVNKLVDTLSICCQSADGTLYRITLREDYTNA